MYSLATQTETVESAEARREQLILEHLPQVNLIARRFHDKVPQSVCLSDIVSTGILGLIAAVDNYDPRSGFKLKTYAEYRIRGAILDSLRSMDWASRHRRKKAKDIESAINKAQQRHGHVPAEDEIATEMGLTLEEYQAQLVEIQGLNIESLEVINRSGGEDSLLSVVADPQDKLPSEIFERSELERVLANSIKAMPEKERLVLSLYYYEELTLREIAEVVGLHISRIAELKSQGILRLRAEMQKKWPTLRGK